MVHTVWWNECTLVWSRKSYLLNYIHITLHLASFIVVLLLLWFLIFGNPKRIIGQYNIYISFSLWNEIDINFKKRNFEKSKFNLRVIWLFLGQMIYTKFVEKKSCYQAELWDFGMKKKSVINFEVWRKWYFLNKEMC